MVRNTNIAFIGLYAGIFKVNLALLAYQQIIDFGPVNCTTL